MVGGGVVEVDVEVLVELDGDPTFRYTVSIPKSEQVAAQLVRLKTTEVMLARVWSFKPM